MDLAGRCCVDDDGGGLEYQTSEMYWIYQVHKYLGVSSDGFEFSLQKCSIRGAPL